MVAIVCWGIPPITLKVQAKEEVRRKLASPEYLQTVNKWFCEAHFAKWAGLRQRAMKWIVVFDALNRKWLICCAVAEPFLERFWQRWCWHMQFSYRVGWMDTLVTVHDSGWAQRGKHFKRINRDEGWYNSKSLLSKGFQFRTSLVVKCPTVFLSTFL